MEKQQIRLTEQDLNMLVEDTVRTYLMENEETEISMGGLRNVAYGIRRGGNWNIRTNYKVGKQASSFNKYAQQAKGAIAKMREIATETQNKPIATSLKQIATQMNTVAKNFTKEAQRIAGPQDYKMTVKNPWAKTTTRTPRAKTPGKVTRGRKDAAQELQQQL